MIEKRQTNKTRIVQFIYEKGQTSKSEIAKNLEISMPTVLQNIKELIEAKVIEETGEYESTGGRKAKALSIIADKKIAIGIDITENHISYVIVNLKGAVIYKKRIRKIFENTVEYYKTMNINLNQFIKEAVIKEDKILGVGISMPGIIDQTNNILLRSHILHISNVSLKIISQFIQYKVHFENDANSAAMAEFKGRDKDAIYLLLSNTVGGSIFIHNKVYLGDNFKSAEFGHMIIESNGRKCYCGKKGCADAYCSAKVLSQHTNDNLDEFFKELENEDKKIKKIWDSYLDYLAITITNLRMTFDCDIIVGGYVGGYLDKYMLELNERISQYNKFDYDSFYLKNCKYGKEGASIGIAMTFVEDYLKNLN